MSLEAVVKDAQKYLRDSRTDGWLIYDYRGLNPIFQDNPGLDHQRDAPLLAVGTGAGQAQAVGQLR